MMARLMALWKSRPDQTRHVESAQRVRAVEGRLAQAVKTFERRQGDVKELAKDVMREMNK